MFANSNDSDEKNKESDKFDWLVFLGGTNDLGWGINVDEIWSAILEVTDIPRVMDNAKLLLCTIPECGVVKASLDAKRDDLNERMRADRREGV